MDQQNLRQSKRQKEVGSYVTPFPVRVHIITWNVGSATPPDDITALLGLNVGDGNTDMYIIG
uniref:Inositol polyphosphate-related phosphatase domain-containing protein n=1 Tax=Poecilia mexicana TaxID=48701 RepID=A0A3B3WYX1_9TELE